MTNLHHFFRATVAASLIGTAAISGAAHADTTSEIAKFNAKTNTYCVARPMTGSLLSQRICATRQGWVRMGATVTPAPTQLASK